MPLPVINDTWQVRFVVTGSPLQRPVTFACHFHDDAGGQTAANLLTDLDASATANMWNLMSSNCGVTKLDVIKLDGVSAGVSSNITGFPAKWTGSGGADAIPQGAAVLSIKCGTRGPAFRNRMYIGPVAEAQSSDGVLSSAMVATCNTAWNTFQTSMSAAGWNLGVVSPSNSSFIGPATLIVRPYLKTQRRRAKR